MRTERLPAKICPFCTHFSYFHFPECKNAHRTLAGNFLFGLYNFFFPVLVAKMRLIWYNIKNGGKV